MRTRFTRFLSQAAAALLLSLLCCSAYAMTQPQVDAEGQILWGNLDTKSQCDAQLLADGATPAQILQFHYSFDAHHTWPPEPNTPTRR